MANNLNRLQQVVTGEFLCASFSRWHTCKRPGDDHRSSKLWNVPNSVGRLGTKCAASPDESARLPVHIPAHWPQRQPRHSNYLIVIHIDTLDMLVFVQRATASINVCTSRPAPMGYTTCNKSLSRVRLHGLVRRVSCHFFRRFN